jgi:glycosyltransferase involved in cell wall biosynthesis
MKISYLITSHNETESLNECIYNISNLKDENDEIIVLDDFSDNSETLNIFNIYSKDIKIVSHGLNKNYGEHKNFGNSICRGDFIFQFDGDEIPSPTFLVNIKNFIFENPNVELFFLPRINDYIGVTELHAKQWGWKLSKSNFCNNRPIVQWPDYQGRGYKNEPSRIKWDRRLHEKIEGHSSYACIPPDENLAIYHKKTIETQLATNKRYNEWFTEAENKGHNVFSS